MQQRSQLFPSGLDMEPARAMMKRIMNARFAKNTVVTYKSGWRIFQRWCLSAGHSAMPADPQTVMDYAAWCLAAGYRLQTVHHRLKSINFHHREEKQPLPFNAECRAFLRQARRAIAERPQGMQPLSPEQLAQISETLQAKGNYLNVRDRSMVLLGFACGWRCSEIVSLDLCDVRWDPKGIELWLAKSKTDQEGKGRSVGIHYGSTSLLCPIAALKAWLELRGDWAGPLFAAVTPGRLLTHRRLDSDAVRRAVKRALKLVGEDPQSFGAHSLRAGMVTAAIDAGASETAVMQRTGHRSHEMVRRYSRSVMAFRSNPLAGVL